MAKRRRVNTTKHEIIQVASEFFFDVGYSATSPRMIAEELDISTGNITYYFPTKDHLLAVIVDMLCDFQWSMMEQEANEGYSSVMAVCLELMAMASMCESNQIAKEFYLASYTSPLTLELIRRNDAKRAKGVFAKFCPDWDDENFVEAETLVSGIEYATLMTTTDSAPLETRIAGALNAILQIYQVPEELRKEKIRKVLSMDYREVGTRVLKEFKEYVEKNNEETLEELFRRKRRKKFREEKDDFEEHKES